MKIRYDKDEDILTIDQGVSGDTIDHAEEIGPIVAHLTKQGRPVLLEILDASDFLAASIRAITARVEGRAIEIG
ncbi:MAG: DUF2283 domain-containing protein [Candidatus Binatia bacterium]